MNRLLRIAPFLIAFVLGCSEDRVEQPSTNTTNGEPSVNSMYFSRSQPWSKLSEEQIVVHDSKSPHAPRMVTMEPWHQIVFLAADGQHTVKEFVDHIGSQYEGGAPDGLEVQIHQIIGDLQNEFALELSSEPVVLPPYLLDEYFQEPPEARKEQMLADGFINDDP